MTIEAPLSRYKKQNMLILIAVMIGLAIWFYYDGHYNKKFIEKHTVNDQPTSTLVFNQKSPPFLILGAIAVGVYFVIIRGKKVAADETGLKACGKTIGYDAIEKVNKTHFDSKGFFVVTYKDEQGQSRDLKLSDRLYDNLPAVLEHLVAKIS
jgi:anaerobic selenocysteine-containing dehydrogenase